MRSRFLSKLRTEKIDKNKWQLTDELMYFSESVWKLIKVPAGFITDLASVPRLPLAYMLAGGKAQEPAVVHDYLYSTKMFTRDVCDDIFYEAILASKQHGWFTANIMWAGVRLGGWAAWRKPNVPQEIELDGNF